MNARFAKLLAFVLSLTLIIGLFGCAPATPGTPDTGDTGDTAEVPTEGKVLRFWHWEGEDTAQSQSWELAMAKFKEKYPDVTIEFERKTFEGMQQNMQMILNSDDVPDVTELNKGNATAGLFSKQGLLTDLTEASAKYGWDEVLSPSIQTTCRYTDQGLMSNEGTLYGITTYGEFIMVYYNKDMFAEYGLEVPTTYAEFQNVAETFIENGVQPLSIGGADNWTWTHNWQELLLYKADRELINNFQFLSGTVDFHNEAFIYATDELANQVTKGYYGTGYNGTVGDDAGLAFSTGQVPMYLSGSWSFGGFMANITDFEWDIFLMPDKQFTTGSGGNLFVVPAKAKNKELAYEFLDMLLDVEVQTEMAIKGGIPVNADTSKIEDPHVRTLNEAFSFIVDSDGLAFYPDWPVPGFMDVLGSGLQEIAAGSKTTDAFLSEVQAAYDEGKADTLGQ